MEITNEIKAKVMMQYWGKDLLIPNYSGYSLQGINSLGLKAFEYSTGRYELFDTEKCKLKLKPLSSITDSDSNSLSDILNVMDCDYFLAAIIDNKKMYSCSILKTINAIQFLQSKGYDLPQYLLGGKTLKEAGLAIYE